MNGLTAKAKTSFLSAYSHLFFQLSGFALACVCDSVRSTSASRDCFSIGRGGSVASKDFRLYSIACMLCRHKFPATDYAHRMTRLQRRVVDEEGVEQESWNKSRLRLSRSGCEREVLCPPPTSCPILPLTLVRTWAVAAGCDKSRIKFAMSCGCREACEVSTT